MSVLVELIAALHADLAAASKRIAYLDSQLEAAGGGGGGAAARGQLKCIGV